MLVILFCLMSAMVIGAISREDYKNGLKLSAIGAGSYAIALVITAILYWIFAM